MRYLIVFIVAVFFVVVCSGSATRSTYTCAVGNCTDDGCDIVVVDPGDGGDLSTMTKIAAGVLIGLSAVAGYGAMSCFSVAMDRMRGRRAASSKRKA
jgi:hypothetical protein